MIAKKHKLRKIGNSQGVIIPTEAIESLGLVLGCEIEISVDENAIIIAPPAPSLDDLIASVPDGSTFSELESGTEGIEE